MEDLSAEKKFLKEKGLAGYKPKLSFEIEKGPYIIKVAETEDELIKTFSLRYEVYGQHYQTPPPVPLDIDSYDKDADHIIIINKEKDQVVGTYRVLCSKFTSDFYTSREFNIDSVIGMNKNFVEMGRATVSETARAGAVITLLWRGLGDYIKQVQAEYLFGCATLWTRDFEYVADVWKLFESKTLFFPKKVFPHGDNNVPDWSGLLEKRDRTPLSDDELKAVSKSLPPLFKSYIKAGAKFGITPANDVKLQSVDYFIICKVTEISGNLVKKYL